MSARASGVRGRAVRWTVPLALSAITIGLAGCVGVTTELGDPPGSSTPPVAATPPSPTADGQGDDPAGPELSPPTTETVGLIDPVAQSFTVEAPAGWDTTAYSTGMYSDHRETVVSVSPDGKTVLFVGDPYAPSYWSPSDPSNSTDAVRTWVEQSEISQWSEYVPATTWIEDWTVAKFGGLDGFVLLSTVDRPEEAQQIAETFRQALGTEITVTAARTTFVYTADGASFGMVSGATYGNAQTWSANIQGLSTLGDPDDYEPMLVAMARSKKITPEWQSRQSAFWQDMQAQSEAFTRQLIDNHNANMQWIRTSAAAHQQRMQAIWSANDASMTSYYDRMASMDGNQRSFLNYIQGENTVQNSAGQSFQVPQGAQVYYVNPTTGNTVGGNEAFGEQDLISMGLNPSDWTLTEIVR
jgi:hypothetical protein